MSILTAAAYTRAACALIGIARYKSEMAAVVSRSARRLLGFSRQVSCPRKHYFIVLRSECTVCGLTTLHILDVDIMIS